MPKDEFDFDDPLELNGVGLVCAQDTTDEMAECFIEEFLRLGYNHKQVLALFRNPFYLGPNMVLQHRGEPFVRERIAEVFARWGRRVEWLGEAPIGPAPSLAASEGGQPLDGARAPSVLQSTAAEPGPEIALEATATDPLGAPAPKLNL